MMSESIYSVRISPKREEARPKAKTLKASDYALAWLIFAIGFAVGVAITTIVVSRLYHNELVALETAMKNASAYTTLISP